MIINAFDKHFRMNEQDAANYMKTKGFFCPGAELVSHEIGDGNINYVFRVSEPKAQKSYIIKHSDILLRSSGRLLDISRNKIEAGYLELCNRLVPGQVPKVYLYDPVMCCIVMQDLADYENMRHALLERRIYPTFADDISTFMAETFIRITDIIMDPMEKKALCRDNINPEMCLISEKLVFTEPFTNHDGTNVEFEENAGFFMNEVYGDNILCLEAAKLKISFLTNAQALIHGDLHTGSIFVKNGHTMVLDPEFAFFGPIGYDVGNVIANLIFAWVNAEVTMCKDSGSGFHSKLEQAISDTVDLFYKKAVNIIKTDAKDRMAQTPGFAEWYMHGVLCDTAGMAGLELIRRVIGDAKVRDIAGIEDREQRKTAERICVLTAKQFIMNRGEKYQNGKDYVDTIRRTRDDYLKGRS